jgi:prepilin-type N-terminal cleavage/methylation domain-containing protein
MKKTRGFTIIELLVVVSIIALLVGILLPAIGKARDQAKLTISQANLRNLATAHATYEAEWNDRQFTLINDNFSQYGSNEDEAWAEFANAHPNHGHPWFMYGCSQGNACFITTNVTFHVPFDWDVSFGSFRMTNAKQLGQYVSGRFYDPVYFAPKDVAAVEAVSVHQDYPGEFDPGGNSKAPSYALSPAAMYNPEVFGNENKGGYVDAFQLKAGHKSPSAGQALFPDLKTKMIEHSWLQNRFTGTEYCNPAFSDGMYNGCEPYYFNHGFSSNPMTLFFDSHIEGLGQQEALQASDKNIDTVGYGLWSTDTPLEGDWSNPAGGYFEEVRADWTHTSHHILTTDGIRGRDKVADG